MGYTENIERNISDSPLIYTRAIRQTLSLRQVMKDVTDFEAYKENFRNELENIRAQFVYRVGYALVKKIHEKHSGTEVPGQGDLLVFTLTTGKDRIRRHEFTVHRDTVLSPKNLDKHPEDLEAYARLLTKSALIDGRINANQERSFVRKARRLLAWKFDKDHTARAARQMILELAFCLGWSAEDCDYLLLRTGLECLCANSVEDQLCRFLLDVPDAKDFSIQPLLELYDQEKQKHPQMIPNSDDASTSITYKSLGEIIKQEATYDTKSKAFVEKLAQNQAVYDRHSNTARALLENTLLHAANGLKWNIKTASSPLSAEHQQILVSAIFSGVSSSKQPLFEENSNIDIHPVFADRNITYPVFSPDGELKRISNLKEHFLNLLAGNAKVRKNDIVFAVFLDFIFNNPDPQDEVENLKEFRETCEDFLDQCYLDRFYMPHPVEYACSKALLSGCRQQEAFLDIVRAYTPEAETPAEAGNTAKWDDPVKRGPLSDHIPAEYDLFERHVKKALTHFPPFETPIARSKNISPAQAFTWEIWEELTVISREVYHFWSKTASFHAFKLEIENGSNVPKLSFIAKDVFYLQHRLSNTLYSFFHMPDNRDHTFLSLQIPMRGEKKTIHELAKDYILSAQTQDHIKKALDGHDHNITNLAHFLEHEPYLSRRLRRKVVLWMISGIILNLYGYQTIELQAKKSARNAHDLRIPEKETHRFTLPTISATANSILKFDHMDPMDVTLALQAKFASASTKKNHGNTQPALPAETSDSGNDTALPREEPSDKPGKQPEASAPPKQTIDTDDETAYPSDPMPDPDALSDSEIEQDLFDPAFVHLRDYLASIAPFKQLPEPELALLAQEAANGNASAQEKLINHNLKLVYYFAKHRSKNPDNMLELISAGNEALTALIKNNCKYDPAKGTFSTFAAKYIKAAMRQEEQKALPISVSKDDTIKEKKIKDFCQDYYGENRRMPTIEAIADRLGMLPSTVKNILLNKISVVSLNQSLTKDAEDTFDKTIPDLSPTPEEQQIRSIANDERQESREDLMQFLDQNLALFTPRELEVLYLRIGFLEDGHAHSILSIAEILKISPTDVIISELNAKKKIQYPLL